MDLQPANALRIRIIATRIAARFRTTADSRARVQPTAARAARAMWRRTRVSAFRSADFAPIVADPKPTTAQSPWIAEVATAGSRAPAAHAVAFRKRSRRRAPESNAGRPPTIAIRRFIAVDPDRNRARRPATFANRTTRAARRTTRPHARTNATRTSSTIADKPSDALLVVQVDKYVSEQLVVCPIR
jgi:hypothetical protein